ncbi:MAG: hypothetical protein UR25_C0001G0138 [Candidatus Nomurabacteria bacterium GW2011_GWE1_32_28]|uniref:Uncharacterized protein n=1 Tax=Candidatus Nomurabacteria bacterium GW2011_GWF1_31_48 TaxID=1618767 RepID=A0A0G0BI44_9BACT|nr:MAG: hypothetical protein UR10_C0001G0091 [Candidatus Nomurabacteria bacterium GW2011_GWF2_30_133]KKP28969.1 MAG: hypothetical protein UR18_C0001G0090 [Candidatus Nomurabacteria bacterium GW2011_GWE2_31_40]KKP30707.1 MAG: hypothetical protein UR19_C0001G0091 [Candidatus Nomurabacteria bacterium GW2011_GWF1_31_48]KKP35225.1 MAG: hypothetical protein UR25_C0001G0138 [Candidatus Nomurabacteria bacterium GW2011_GWE1_32_28]HAS80532.1 hypothetical protein [Candidatus Nomurabacteria bacterium]
MEKELKDVFLKAKYQDQSNLVENIWKNILIRDRRIAFIKFWVFSFLSFSSLIGLIPAWKILSNDLAQSGVYEYFSLMFSNSNYILSYWKELTFSIAEVLPTTSILLLFSLVFVVLLSAKYASRQVNKSQFKLSFN